MKDHQAILSDQRPNEQPLLSPAGKPPAIAREPESISPTSTFWEREDVVSATAEMCRQFRMMKAERIAAAIQAATLTVVPPKGRAELIACARQIFRDGLRSVSQPSCPSPDGR